jgi:hypothetical protein
MGIDVPPPAGSGGEARNAVSATVALDQGWSAALERRAGGAVLRVDHPRQGGLAVEIALTAEGPVVRLTAAALELNATGTIAARCETFTVDASDRIELRAGRIEHQASGALVAEAAEVAIAAREADVQIRANDDVRVHGEQVLLNCDEDDALPDWLPQATDAPALLPRRDADGGLDPADFGE